MEDEFQIPVIINGKELSFSASIIASGYITKIAVKIYGETVFYEPDEEGQYRALISNESLNNEPQINVELLKEIAKTIESVRT